MSESTMPQDERTLSSGRFFTIFSVAAAIIAFDQWTKWLVRRDIPLNTEWLPESLAWLSPYARFLHIQNRGASFGMFQNGNTVFAVLALLIVAGILYITFQMKDSGPWMSVAAGLYLGGAVGNLIDRLTIGAVTDFVSVGNFYIFNVADASINISVAMLIILMILHERKAKRNSHSQDTGAKS